MSNKSNNQGRAYEFAYLINLEYEISKYRKVKVLENSSYDAAKKAWDSLNDIKRGIYETSALAGIGKIFELEPLILENSDSEVELSIQSDDKGKNADVRDILIKRNDISWEIGLSIKHNHFAVKHSRLSKKLDFGQKWYGFKCSDNYWSKIKPIFDFLDNSKGLKWSELHNKEDNVYIPLLNAFRNEILQQYALNQEKVAKSMVEYLLGEFDFYKLISIDKKQITQIQAYNMHGDLGMKSQFEIPLVCLPNQIIYLDFKKDSKNTLELYLNNGWQFSFRIHNASTMVESSLKFDVQIIGMPVSVLTINCIWSNNG
ncbi:MULTISPECIES: HaeIII family restriction endonuclease [unclassified Campylobacter]|uniref:HaeIII family restriction endonuclease n=1 Tax=unclassified Campylobacter TaxID=2593542 RepID=UPI001BD98959|nr:MULTISPECIES: HaeIII family restriction endonuclease [unclassified Campylobacter]MBT0880685.1 HaeIII family restriction endonuclease [Campylobacter sp. 2018MI27]MBT0884835.1 HaeIII family restriction endonuclease [Campylobacter sp. 2018MI10]